MTINIGHLHPSSRFRRHPDPAGAAAAQLHRGDLPDRDRNHRARHLPVGQAVGRLLRSRNSARHSEFVFNDIDLRRCSQRGIFRLRTPMQVELTAKSAKSPQGLPRRPAQHKKAKARDDGQVGLRLRRRRSRGRGRYAQPARRQGREPRRDGEPRPAGAARLHHHDRGLHLFLRQREAPTRRSSRRRSKDALAMSARITGRDFGDAGQPAARLGALRRARLDAGHDGYGAQSRPQRRDGRGAGEDLRRPPLRL